MAEMNVPDSAGPKSKVRMKKAVLRVDLTPMVDLAFLLITFFMLTTTLLEQRAMKLDTPAPGPPAPVSECQVLNLLTDSLGQVYCWEGLDCHTVDRIGLKGDHSLGDRIRAKKKYLRSNCLYASGKSKDMICLIKLLPGSQYEHMVRVLDEVATDSVPTYAIQPYTEEEVKAVHAEQQRLAVR